jgi:hypothetical protein
VRPWEEDEDDAENRPAALACPPDGGFVVLDGEKSE